MKRKKILSFFDFRYIFQMPAFTFLIAVFLCGVFAGGFTGVHIPQSDGEYIKLLGDYCVNSVLERSLVSTILLSVLESIALPTVIILVAALFKNNYILALVVAMRAFIMSFSVTAIICDQGVYGIYISLATIGVPAIIAVPCIILIGTIASNAIDSAYGKGGFAKGFTVYWREIRGIITLLIISGIIKILTTSAVGTIVLKFLS